MSLRYWIPMNSVANPVSRRQFVGAAGSAITAKSYAQIAGSGERLRVGVIGCGGMATGHMRALVGMKSSDNVDVAAVCDLYDKRAQQGSQLTGAPIVKDYRDLLARKDIDYVLIATPEHWHYQMTMDAASAGKHIYCEKPMTHTIEQSKKVIAKIARTGVKMQVGIQGMSDDSYETAWQYVKKDTIGKVVLAQIDYSRNHVGDFWAYPIDPDARPGENLDWKAWLGSAPKRPWDPDRYFRWRRYWDYSGGIATDLFIHRVARIIRALNLQFPDKAVATGGKFEFTQSVAEIPDTFNAILDYPGGLSVLLVSSMANSTPVEHVLRGHKATLTFTRTGFTIKPQREFANDVEEFTYAKHGAEDVTLHHRNLQNAIRKNEPLKCDCTFAFQAGVACEMAVQSYRRRRYLAWDAGKQRIVKA